jgi:hypothetical protein
MDSLVQFSWAVWTGGYEVREIRDRLYLCEKGTGEHRRYAPQTHQELFRAFSEIAAVEDKKVPDAAVRFASDYGLLGFRPSANLPEDFPNDRRFEPLRMWEREANQMDHALGVWDAARVGDTFADELRDSALRALRFSPGLEPPNTREIPEVDPERRPFRRMAAAFNADDPETFAKNTLALNVGAKLDQLGVRSTLTFQPENKRIRFVLEPTSLAAALWLHFAIVIEGNVEIRRCRGCGNLMEIGLHQEGKRTNRWTCSDKCRAVVSRRKRKEEAKRKTTRKIRKD